jgi:2-methylcitrate dehydratase PrpD
MGLSICERPQGWKPDWYQTPVHGVFGAAVACSKLLSLDVARMQNALGIALHHAAGTLEGPGIPSAFAAKGAVLSALMAHQDITGARDSLEGTAGLYNVYYGGDYNRERLVAGLGSRFESIGISLKPWPGLRYFHPYIDATLQLVREHDITAEIIKRITIFVAGYVQGGCEPIEARRAPTTLYEANISLPYLVALAATKRRVLIQDIVPEALKDTLVLRVAQLVFPEVDERFSIANKIGPALVAIELTNGKSYSKQMEIAYGHPRNPMTEEDFLIKLRDCASQSVKPLSDKNVERITDMGRHLEEIDDVTQFIRFLG